MHKNCAFFSLPMIRFNKHCIILLAIIIKTAYNLPSIAEKITHKSLATQKNRLSLILSSQLQIAIFFGNQNFITRRKTKPFTYERQTDTALAKKASSSIRCKQNTMTHIQWIECLWCAVSIQYFIFVIVWMKNIVYFSIYYKRSTYRHRTVTLYN